MSKLSKRDFILVNHMLGLVVTVNAECRDQAKDLAVNHAKGLGYTVPDNHAAYWNPKRAYHDTGKYTVI